MTEKEKAVKALQKKAYEGNPPHMEMDIQIWEEAIGKPFRDHKYFFNYPEKHKDDFEIETYVEDIIAVAKRFNTCMVQCIHSVPDKPFYRQKDIFSLLGEKGAKEDRLLTGFVDGTENPDGRVAVNATAIGDEDQDFAGGCYVHVQKYLHDMSAWNALSVTEQERVIGRTKLEDIELGDDVKPANSHVALNVIEDDAGNELKIVRHNMPFGEVGTGEFGTYFIGYSRTPAVTERMLRNMFIGDPPGNTDRILDFSTAVTGSMFFTPTADFLDDPPPLPAGEDESAPPAPSYAGSLAIGSLKGQA